MLNITAAIVLYNNPIQELQQTIQGFLDVPFNLRLYLIDNSATSKLQELAENRDWITYIHNPANPGFGSAHNIAITEAIKQNSRYHFIVNPDIQFKSTVVSEMVNHMQVDQNIGMIMPKVLNEDGTVQYLPKLLPNIFWILRRKLRKFDLNHQNFIDKYELRKVGEDEIYNAPILSGCFTLLNLKAIREVGMYDDRYFMYFEDWDLSRRMHEKYKTIYFPSVSVYHGYESGANRSTKLFKIFIKSAFTYFNKWGWFFDKDRAIINEKALSQF